MTILPKITDGNEIPGGKMAADRVAPIETKAASRSAGNPTGTSLAPNGIHAPVPAGGGNAGALGHPDLQILVFRHLQGAGSPLQGARKKRARLNCMRHFLSTLDYPKKNEHVVGHADPLIVGSTTHVIRRSDHILGRLTHPDMKRGRNI